MKLLVIAALLITACHAENRVCKTAWPVQVCYVFQSNPVSSTVTISVKALETQSDYLPITGYFVNGRVQLTDGTNSPFHLSITRANWGEDNSTTVSLPPDAVPVGIPHLAVIVRRNSESVIVY
jgi:hypothetical protein